jgi:uncharacterized protein YlxW (UPF0749 family)
VIDPNASDWSDLDLLTKAEADERLAREIGELERQLADPSDERGDTERQQLQRRLSLLRKRLGR